MHDIRERIEQVENRIVRAASRAGRPGSSITLVGVTKTVPADLIQAAYEAGLRDFGENYIQEFESKSAALLPLPGARFHFIGHLQSNKAKRAAELFDIIETVDSPKLAQRLDAAPVRRASGPIELMLEVKLSAEQAKSGAAPEQIPEILSALAPLGNLRLTGLMTMPPWSDDPEASRSYFRQLRELAERHNLPRLSMGMSHDLEVAIEEGATEVRVGTALFGSRPRP